MGGNFCNQGIFERGYIKSNVTIIHALNRVMNKAVANQVKITNRQN